MYNIKTMNHISPCGLQKLEARGCTVGENVSDPDGLILRSADLHDYAFEPSLIAIARSGAGTNNRNVHVILSGMSAEDQLTDNLATFARFEPLTAAETAAVEQTAAFLHSRIKIGCTGCRYCMPCPMGVDIPDNFSIWNKLGMFGQPEAIKHQWEARFPDAEKASHCVRCGKCEAACPQHLPIRNALAQLQQELDQL